MGSLRTGHVQEIRMHEAKELSRLALDSDAHVDDVVDGAEKLVELAVGHVEGEVTDVERTSGRLVGAAQCRVGLGELDDDAAAFEDLRVHGFDGTGGGFHRVEGDVSEPVKSDVSIWVKISMWADTPFAEATRVMDNCRIGHVSELLEMICKIGRRNVEK